MDQISCVCVGSDVTVIDVSADVAFWGDLETSVLERVADRIDDIGAEIEININKLDHCLKVVLELLAGKLVSMLQ